MKQALIKVQAMLNYFELQTHITGRQTGTDKEIKVFAQSPFFDIGIRASGNYVVFCAFDRFEHNKFLHTMVHLDDVEVGIALVQELLDEQTNTTL